MKKLGVFLIIVGLITVILSGYGYAQLSRSASQTGLRQRDVEALLSLGSAFGMESEMSFQEQLQMFSIQNRSTLLIAGVAALLLGIVLKTVGKKEQQQRQSQTASISWWTCPSCQTKNPQYMGKCQKCGRIK